MTTTARVPILNSTGRLPDAYAPQGVLDAQATVYTETWSGAVSPTWKGPIWAHITLTGDVTVTLPTLDAGHAVGWNLDFAQDATGGHTVTLIDAMTSYGVALIPAAAANARTVWGVLWTGEDWLAVEASSTIAVPTGWAAA